MSDQSARTLNLAALPPLPPRVQNRLHGRVVDPGWLAAGLHPDVDVARERHHELLGLVADTADELSAAKARWAGEDREHAAALREAVRSGEPEPPDERSTPEERATQQGRLVEKLQAAAEVLAEHIAHAVDVVRKAENDILAGLKGQAGAARDQRREAEEQLAAAHRAEWKLARLARWTMQTADDPGGFGQQPAPTGDENPPDMFQLRDGDLERIQQRRDPWAEVDDLARDALDRITGGDPTGQVSGLVNAEESEGAAA
jgi:hypothetical protein